MRFAPAAALLTFFAAAALAQAPATPAPAAVPEPSRPNTVKPSDKLLRL